MSSTLIWFLLSAVWVAVGLVAVFPALLSPMMFDSPGATSNPLTVGFAASVAVFPLFCLAGAVLPWILQHWPWAKWFFLLPLADLCAIIGYFYAINHFNGGSFGPRSR